MIGGTQSGIHSAKVSGQPTPKYIGTSWVERQNWTVRTNRRRDTRLSNGFSRKIKNHARSSP